jgi:hypothetical protein
MKSDKEQWFCLDCQQVGDLTLHGKCSTCNSDSVVSTEAQHLHDRND